MCDGDRRGRRLTYGEVSGVWIFLAGPRISAPFHVALSLVMDFLVRESCPRAQKKKREDQQMRCGLVVRLGFSGSVIVMQLSLNCSLVLSELPTAV